MANYMGINLNVYNFKSNNEESVTPSEDAFSEEEQSNSQSDSDSSDSNQLLACPTSKAAMLNSEPDPG
jgi:hypothetical protein